MKPTRSRCLAPEEGRQARSAPADLPKRQRPQALSLRPRAQRAASWAFGKLGYPIGRFRKFRNGRNLTLVMSISITTENLADLVEKVGNSLVRIDAGHAWSGTGTVWAEGVIVTAQ